MKSAHGFSLFIIFMLGFTTTTTMSLSLSESTTTPLVKNGSLSSMVPLMEEGKLVRMVNESRRRLRSFRICGVCTCCGGPKGLCLPSPCCYAIDCNIPNRPFGFCAFTPKTCNCFGCHL